MCFSLALIEQLLVWAVIICAVYALVMLVVPWVMSKVAGVLGDVANIIVQAVKIVFWAFVAILVIYFIFWLIGCVMGMGGGIHLPTLR